MAWSGDEPIAIDEDRLELRLISDPETDTGALLVLASDEGKIQALMRSLVHAMFPSEGSGDSSLLVQTERDGLLLLEARGGGSQATIAVTNLGPTVPDFVATTLSREGSIPILFGFHSGDQIVLLNPLRNHIVKTHAFVGTANVYAGTHRRDWTSFFANVEADFATVETVDD